MKKKMRDFRNRIMVFTMILLLLCYKEFLSGTEVENCYGSGLLYISTTSFTEMNTGMQGDLKEYQMSGTAELADNGTVVLVPNESSKQGKLESEKKICIENGFSMAFKLNMGQGTEFFAGNIQVMLEGIEEYEGNNLILTICKDSDTEISTTLTHTVVQKETELESEEAESIPEEESVEITEIIKEEKKSVSGFVEGDSIETAVYCWIDYSNEDNNMKIFLSKENTRPEEPQVSYSDIDIFTHMGENFKIAFSATNPEDKSQKVALSSFLFDNIYHTEGINITSYENGQNLDSSNEAYEIIEVTYNLRIQYLYEDGTMAASTYEAEYKEGQAYTVVSPDIDGYIADCVKVEGIVGTEDIEKTVYYKKILTYADLPNNPTADISTQSRAQDIWAKLPSGDLVATENTYVNTSRPLLITAKQYDDSVMSSVCVSAFQLMHIGTDGYVINEAYQAFFDEKLQKNVTAGEVLEWFLTINNAQVTDFAEEVISYIEENQIAPVACKKGEAESTFIELDCSRRYEQERGYYAGYGYYLLYGEDSAGVEYVLAEFTSRTPESNVYLKGNSLSLKKEVGKLDYSMNEDMVFTIYATLPNLENVSNIENYKYCITDSYGTGIMPLEDTLKLQAVDADGSMTDLVVNDDYTFTCPSDGKWEISCNFATGSNLKKNQQMAKTLKVTYRANFNDNAVIGLSGNENFAVLSYTSNPAEESYVEKSTEESKVFVYTYQLQMTKQGSDGILLYDALFEVYNGAGNPLYFLKSEEGCYCPVQEGTEGAVSRIATETDGTLNITGIGIGEYTFKEAEPPDGYQKIPEFTLFVESEYSDGVLTKLGARVNDNSYIQSVICELESGTIALTVVDPVEAGQLPGTGSMGRIIPYILGSIFLGIGIVMATNRKQAKLI